MKLAVVMLTVLACSPEPASTVVEVPPPTLPSPPLATAAPLPPVVATPRAECEPPPSLAGCTEVARVRVGPIQPSSPSCSLDLRAGERQRGTLLRCPSGAVVRFDSGTFSGTFGGESISTCAKTKFPYRGCIWESVQRIEGPRSALQFTYAERVIEGHDCPGTPCTAYARIEVETP